ncbi:MAG: hypothetical protein HS117_23140 [Verrucomicrobiaceae bacterium]|nr:hypothetical protein [Verrucomicrobiaceae bacterium]
MPVTALVCPHCEKPVEIQVAGVTRSRPCPECGEMLMLQVAEKGKKARRRALLMGGTVPEVPVERTISLPIDKLPPELPPESASTPPALASTRIVESEAPPPASPKSQRTAAFGGSIASRNGPSVADEEESRPPTTGSLPRPLVLEPSHEPQVLAGDAFDRMRMDPEVKEFRRRLITGTSFVAVILVIVILVNWLAGGSLEEAPAKASTAATEDGAPAVTAPEHDEPPPVPAGTLVFKAPGRGEFQRVEASGTGLSSSQMSMEASLSAQVLRQFLAAPTWKERLAWCRPLPGLEEQMQAFYAAHADGPVPFDNIIESREADGGFFQHTVVFEGGGRRQAHVQQTPKGARVDWASFVGAGEMNWSDLLAQRPAVETLVRVMVKEGFYYENQFGSPRILKCLELRNIAEPGAPMIHGYVDRNSSVALKIEAWQRQAEGVELPMVLRLKYPVDSRSDRQVWVADAICKGWLVE